MKQSADWWPASLGTLTSVGSQNDLRYAFSPEDWSFSKVAEIYDTGNRRILGVVQAQCSDQTLTFTSQDGLVRVAVLPKVAN
jgi:hypothetical protein